MIVKGTLLIVHFRSAEAFLCPVGVPIRNTSLPGFIGEFPQIVHWECRVLSFEKTTKKIRLEILHYGLGTKDLTVEQVKLEDELREVAFIDFRSIDTLKLMSGVRSKRAIRAMSHEKDPEEPFLEKAIIQVPITDLLFDFGGVRCDHYFKGYTNPIHIFIPNPHLRPEYDAVKGYYAKELGKNSIEVTVSVEIHANHLEFVSADSPDLNRIGEESLEAMRFEFVQDIKKRSTHKEIDKSLFTMDEYIDHFTEAKPDSANLYTSGRDLFHDLLQVSDSKHYRQLRYLAECHANHILKLRFVADPISFVFLVEGREQFHLVWETLDTEEATYVWHLDKNLDDLRRELRKIEQILLAMRVQGKTAYLANMDQNVERIFHDYSAIRDGFIIWKGKLTACLY